MTHDERREMRGLRAVVANLPKTADGVPIVPGMTLYGWETIPVALMSGGMDAIVDHLVESVHRGGDWFAAGSRQWARGGNNYYSTREGAEAARARVVGKKEAEGG